MMLEQLDRLSERAIGVNRAYNMSSHIWRPRLIHLLDIYSQSTSGVEILQYVVTIILSTRRYCSVRSIN